MNSLVDSVLNSKSIDVYVSESQQPKTKWKPLHKGKVWINDQGNYVVNESTNWNGVPNRLFFGFVNYEDYNSGRNVVKGKNLHNCKIAIEEYMLGRNND